MYAYVRHLGELTARIQKGWTLPGDGGAGDFHCRARIRQDEAGEIEEIELERCDDDGALRASLLRAVHSAVPLPLLDEGRQSARVVTLDFAVFAAQVGGRRTSVQPGPAP